jgi:hypothetical protein
MPHVLRSLTFSTPMLQPTRAWTGTHSTKPGASALLVETADAVSGTRSFGGDTLRMPFCRSSVPLKVVGTDRVMLGPGCNRHATRGTRRRSADSRKSRARTRWWDSSGKRRIHCVDLSALETATCIGSAARVRRSPMCRSAVAPRGYSSSALSLCGLYVPLLGRSSRLSPRSR